MSCSSCMNYETYTVQDMERFWKKVQVAGPDECWLWTGTTGHGDRYGNRRGQFGFNGKTINATRFAVWITTGQWPGKLLVCHSCDNNLCVNPKHLWLGTQKDNMVDAAKKGRIPVGEANSAAKLTENDVREIRSKYKTGKWTQCQLAEAYGVTQVPISHIIRRKNWKHVK